MRNNGRGPQELRKVTIEPDVVRYAEGSAQVEFGHTRVLCTASVEKDVPKWITGEAGWVSAEYGMLPRSTHTRMRRDKIFEGGRTQEISRLIGRSLRAAIDLKKLGPRLIAIDCDVIQADGGTRTAAITGGFVALALALKFLQDQGQLSGLPITNYVSAVSVGLKNSVAMLDLDYEEDSSIDTDMNFVMNQKKEFIEIQGTAESGSFNPTELQAMLVCAEIGCAQLIKLQRELIGKHLPYL